MDDSCVRRIVLVTVVVMAIASAPEARAQTVHAAPESALDAAVHERVDAIGADRDAILRVLGRSEVRTIAKGAGVDLRQRTAAVATLEGEDLARVAAHARQVDEALAGGQTASQYFFYFLGLAIVPLIVLLIWAF